MHSMVFLLFYTYAQHGISIVLYGVGGGVVVVVVGGVVVIIIIMHSISGLSPPTN